MKQQQRLVRWFPPNPGAIKQLGAVPSRERLLSGFH